MGSRQLVIRVYANQKIQHNLFAIFFGFYSYFDYLFKAIVLLNK